MPENKACTLVAYMRVGQIDTSKPLYPPERYKEVERCKNARVKQEKYTVWKLLEKAVTNHLNLDFANLQFTKTANGKWICPDFHFSLSHTDGLVCVAVSRTEVGVDVEIVRDINEGLKKRILTEKELSFMETLPSKEKQRFLLESWVKKESIFKKSGNKMLMPNNIETSEYRTELRYIEIGGDRYLISVSDDANAKNNFRFMEEI